MADYHKIYMAPFQGITTFTYREVYSKYFSGIDKLTTPFFVGNQKPNGTTKKALEFNFTHHNRVEVVPQMLSKDADELSKFAEFCHNKGYSEINWNLGCPYPRVANKKRGSGMLPYPEMVHDILTKVMANIDINFSIKCRLGYFDDDEILALMDVFNLFNISELIIHARIGKQLYAGDVRLDALTAAVSKSKLPIVYNGDIFSKNDFENIRIKVNVDRWMVGRCLLVDPFLPQKIKEGYAPDLEEQKHIVYKFITDLYLAYRKSRNNKPQSIGVVKELWGFLAYSFSNPQKIFNAIKKTKSFDEYEEVVAQVFKRYDWLGSDAELLAKRLKSPSSVFVQ